MTPNNSLSLRNGALTLIAIALTGCAAMEESAPHLDGQMGQAARAIWAAQTLNPQAGRNADPVNGIDGVSAVTVIHSYQQSSSATGSGSSGASTSSGSSGSNSSSGTSR